jgi:hypothetical protein
VAACVFAAVVMGVPATAFGQASTGAGLTASIGYQVLHIPDETFPFGMNFDVAAPVMPTVHLVGEFGFATDDQSEPGVSGNLKMYNLGGGARWTPRRSSAATRGIVPFAQLLIGAVRSDADLVQNGQPFNAGDWAFMLQPGAGVAVPFSSMAAVVGQFDYRRAFFTEGENEYRFVVGVQLHRR